MSAHLQHCMPIGKILKHKKMKQKLLVNVNPAIEKNLPTAMLPLKKSKQRDMNLYWPNKS